MPNNAGIKAFVIKLLRNGNTRHVAWKEAQKRFPHRIVGWSYVCAIANKERWGEHDRPKPKRVK